MGEALIVRRGGGASLNGVALIWCEFPVEATSVTCSNGVKTYSVPTKWLSSGGYCFSVDAEGPWILTASNANYNDISTIENSNQ